MLEKDRFPFVPLEDRWKITREGILKLSFAYDKAFRKVVGDSYDYFEYEVFRAFGNDRARLIVNQFDLPGTDAPEVAESWNCINQVLFGTEAPGGDVLEMDEDRFVTEVRDCPFLDMARDAGLEAPWCFKACEGFNQGVVKGINHEFSLRIPMAKCRNSVSKCEMVIERKPWERQ